MVTAAGCPPATARAIFPIRTAPAVWELDGPTEFVLAPDMQPLTQGPFYAMDISVDSRFLPLPIMSFGGLRVEEESGLVLDAQGKPIEGLYAAGRTAVGVASQTYVSGLSFADCVFSGRRAARHAAHANV